MEHNNEDYINNINFSISGYNQIPNHYPIFKNSNFKQIHQELVDAHNVDLEVRGNKAIECIAEMKTTHGFIADLKTIYGESQAWLEQINDSYTVFSDNGFKQCFTNKLNSPISTHIQTAISLTPQFNDFIDRTRTTLRKQYSCDFNPIREGIDISNLKETKHKPFYDRMYPLVKDHIKTIKEYLEKLISDFDIKSYSNDLSEFTRYKKALQGISPQKYIDSKKTEKTTWLEKTEAILKSSEPHLSSDLSQRLKQHIVDLKAEVAMSEEQNRKISKFEKDLTAAINDIEEFAKTIPENRNEIISTEEKIKIYLDRMHDFEQKLDRRYYVYFILRMDMEIGNFIESEKPLYEKIQSIKDLKTSVKGNYTILETTEKQMKAERELVEINGDTNSRLNQIIVDVEDIETKEIPELNTKLNTNTLNKKFQNLQNPTETLDDIKLQKVKLLNNLTSFDSQLGNHQLTTIEEDLSQTQLTVNQVTKDNGIFMRFLSSHESSSSSLLHEYSVTHMKTFFSAVIEKINEDVQDINSKPLEIKSKITQAKGRIRDNRLLLNDIRDRSSALAQEYVKLDTAKNTLSKQLILSPDQFEKLFTKIIEGLDFKITAGVSHLSEDFAQYNQEVSNIRDSVNEIVDKLYQLEQEKNDISKKTENLKKLHSSLKNTIENGLDSEEKPKISEFRTIKTQFNKNYTQYETTLKEHKNNKQSNREYYTESVNRANEEIEGITQINNNESINQLLHNNLSVSNTFDSFNNMLTLYGESDKKSETLVRSLKKKYDQLSNNIYSNKRIFLTTMHAIENQIDKYNTTGIDSSMFLDDAAVEKLVNENQEVENNYKIVKIKIKQINDEIEELSTTYNKLNSEINQIGSDIEEQSKTIETEKNSHEVYFEKLKSMKQKAGKINETRNLLAEIKSRLIKYQNSTKIEHDKNVASIENKSDQLSQSQALQLELLVKAKKEMSENYHKYDHSYKNTLKKASEFATDISEDNKKLYNEITAMHSDSDAQYDSQMETVNSDTAKGIAHYAKEKEEIEQIYFDQNSKLDALLEEIDALSKKLLSESEENIYKITIDEYNTLVKKIENHIQKNRNNVDFIPNEFDKATAITLGDNTKFEAKIEEAISKDKNFEYVLNQDNPSHLRNRDADEELKVKEDTSVNSQSIVIVNHGVYDNYGDSINALAVKGKAEVVSAEDYFVIIITIAAIALIVIFIVGAIRRYRTINRNKIYKKCEEVYIKA